MGATSLLLMGKGGVPPTPPIHRGPLGPFPDPVNYPTTLNFTPPPGPDLYFYRGNFCGLNFPDAPQAPGNNDQNPACVMACLLDGYPVDFQNRYLDTYAGYGYTHLQRSIGHTLYYGGTVQSHIELTKRAQARGLFADEWLLGAPALMTPNQDAAYWAPILQPIIDQLLGAGAIDSACVGWQLDTFNTPGNPLISIIAYIAGALPRTIPLYTHWVNEALAWWKTGGEVWQDPYQTINVYDRFTWWYAMQPYLTGGYYQGDNQTALTNPKLFQDRLCDTLDPFSGDTHKGDMGQSFRRGFFEPFRLVGTEIMAQYEFDNKATELQGDTAGYLVTCTHAYNGGHPSGYGNGARMPDGSPL